MFFDTFIVDFYCLHLAPISRVSICTASLVSSLISLLPAAEAWRLSAVTDVSPFKSQGEALVSRVGGEGAADHEACNLQTASAAEVKHTRLSLQSHLPRGSLRRKIYATVGEKKRRSKFVIENSRSHYVLFLQTLHPNFKRDIYLTQRLGCKQDCFSITFHNIMMYHLFNYFLSACVKVMMIQILRTVS